MIGVFAARAGKADYGHPRSVSVAPAVALLVASLALQMFLPMLLPFAAVLNLPLLVGVYFMLLSHAAVPSMVLGLALGWAHDGLVQGPVGPFGLAYTVLGYMSALARQHIKVKLAYVLAAVVAAAYVTHEILLYVVNAHLIGRDVPFELGLWCALAFLHTGLALLTYPLFDSLVGRR